MATATMGLRRRVTVNNSPTPQQNQQSPTSSSSSSSSSVTASSKRSRAENNNSPSHGNLNSLSRSDEPPTKKSRGSSSVRARANSPAVTTEGSHERVGGHHGHHHQTSSKGRSVNGGKSSSSNSNSNNNSNNSSRTRSPSTSTTATSNATSTTSNVTAGSGQQQQDISNVLTSTWPTSTGVPETASYASMTGLNMSGMPQTGPSSAVGGLGLPQSIPYMAASMATFVGNATNLGKNSAVSYLDISNMTGGSMSNSSSASSYACKSGNSVQEAKGSGASVALPFSGVAPTNGGATGSAFSAKSLGTNQQSGSGASQVPNAAKTFQNDSMFNAYQPWVIKTYGDLAKTKTITIKKYARILRTLKGEEVNSAENSKFRFWVKSKGFHIAQPVGYDAKPADRIVGRHAVSSPGLDPPLYVPTQLPHNKALNGAEGTVPPGRVYKKVAIVENFFDIIHAVHVDLEGRPGKHAGQKRTYRTITETYAFLPREAVTRFLLGCTECQRRPRTPSPSNLSNQSQAASVSSVPPAASTVTGSSSTTTTTPPPTPTPSSTPTPTTTPLSPTPAATALSAPQPLQSSPKPREASHPPESISLFSYRHPKHQHRSSSTSTSSSIAAPKLDNDRDKDKIVVKERVEKTERRDKEREEKYNPLSITNLLKKEPSAASGAAFGGANVAVINADSLAAEFRRTPESDRASSRSSASSKRRRMLPEGRTPSPPPVLPWPTPWSPGLDTTSTPIDYSLPITTTYLKHQQRIRAEQDRAEAAAAAAAALQEERDREMQREASPMGFGMSDVDVERDRFSPAAGLIDTNLNLLATIQHLHCQVMLALTERLRPSVSPASLMLPPATGVLPNCLMGAEFAMPMAHHHS